MALTAAHSEAFLTDLRDVVTLAFQVGLLGRLGRSRRGSPGGPRRLAIGGHEGYTDLKDVGSPNHAFHLPCPSLPP